jgi:hypothetical protein
MRNKLMLLLLDPSGPCRSMSTGALTFVRLVLLLLDPSGSCRSISTGGLAWGLFESEPSWQCP